MTENMKVSNTSWIEILFRLAWRALLILFVAAIITEGGSRILIISHPDLPRSLGFQNFLFEIKWFQLQNFVAQNGEVDLVILGSSLAHTSIDPAVMEKIIFERTGQTLHIYSFGIDAVTMPAALAIGRLVARTYHPDIILFISEFRDFDALNGQAVNEEFLHTPWLEYQMGGINLVGWLVDHSEALQLFLPYRNWISSNFSTQLADYQFRQESFWENGYEANNGITDLEQRNLSVFRPGEKYFTTLFDRYEIDTQRLNDLETFIDEMDQSGIQVVLAEWPFPSSTFDSGLGEEAENRYLSTIQMLEDDYHLDVILPMAEENVPQLGRADRYHFNRISAEYFSQYLGSQISESTWFRDGEFVDN